MLNKKQRRLQLTKPAFPCSVAWQIVYFCNWRVKAVGSYKEYRNNLYSLLLASHCVAFIHLQLKLYTCFNTRLSGLLHILVACSKQWYNWGIFPTQELITDFVECSLGPCTASSALWCSTVLLKPQQGLSDLFHREHCLSFAFIIMQLAITFVSSI